MPGKFRRFFILLMTPVAIIMVSSHALYSQTRINRIHAHKARSFLDSNHLEGNLIHLNLCGERPEHIQEIYIAAFNTLISHLDAGFIELAGNQAFLDLCRENGMTHSGGPMLGNISSEGASVWIRTLKPATVEVRIDAHGVTRTFGPVNSSGSSDLTAVVRVNGLKPGTSYPYRVFIDGRQINTAAQQYIREKGNFLGDQQMEWLKEQLLDCEGPFIILSNGTILYQLTLKNSELTP